MTANMPQKERVLGEGHQKQQIKNLIGGVSFYAMVLFTVLFCTLPLLWMIAQSLLNVRFGTINGLHNWYPSNAKQFTWTNYSFVLGPTIGLTRSILNSFIIASFTTILCVGIGASSSYVLAQFEFKLRTGLLGLILSMTMFPGIVIIVPLFVEYLFINENLGINLINSYPGIILPYIVTNLPLTVYLLYNFFQEIPKELISAARVDGASDFQIFRKVILPLAMPGVFTTAILVFIAAWNEFLFASILLKDVSKRTIPVALSIFTGIPPPGFNTDPNHAMMAATALVTIPLIIMVLIFQKQIVAGLTAGAVKG